MSQAYLKAAKIVGTYPAIRGACEAIWASTNEQQLIRRQLALLFMYEMEK